MNGFSVKILSVILLTTLSSAARAADSIRATGPEGAEKSWTIDEFKTAFAADLKKVDITSRGEKHTLTAVPLLSVLKSTGVELALKMDPKADPKQKNANLRLAIVVQGADGYTATFSLGELLPDIGNREVLLAFEEDGKPLAAKDGNLKLVVPSDQKPARWVRDVAKITVVDPVRPREQK